MLADLTGSPRATSGTAHNLPCALFLLQLIVRTLSGKAVSVPIGEVRTVADLKTKALAAMSAGSAPLVNSDMCLGVRGRLLEEDRLLSDYGFGPADSVVLLRKPGKRCGLFVKASIRAVFRFFWHSFALADVHT